MNNENIDFSEEEFDRLLHQAFLKIERNGLAKQFEQAKIDARKDEFDVEIEQAFLAKERAEMKARFAELKVEKGFAGWKKVLIGLIALGVIILCLKLFVGEKQGEVPKPANTSIDSTDTKQVNPVAKEPNKLPIAKSIAIDSMPAIITEQRDYNILKPASLGFSPIKTQKLLIQFNDYNKIVDYSKTRKEFSKNAVEKLLLELNTYSFNDKKIVLNIKTDKLKVLMNACKVLEIEDIIYIYIENNFFALSKNETKLKPLDNKEIIEGLQKIILENE
jgi:hypothetical protein